MFGVNYKYEINEQKNLIKLRPTLGSTLAFAAVTTLATAGPLFLFAVAVDYLAPKKPTNTEDHLPHD